VSPVLSLADLECAAALRRQAQPTERCAVRLWAAARGLSDPKQVGQRVMVRIVRIECGLLNLGWNEIGVGEVVAGVNPLTDVSDRAEPVDGVDARFQRFYAQQFAATVRLAWLLTGDSHAAEDVAQDAFVKLYRYAEASPRRIGNPAALLRTTTVNLCRTWHTRLRRAELRMTRHGPDPTSLTEWERELDASLRRLPHDQRAVIVLRYWLGLSEAEIADALECRPGTVKSRHARALRALRKELP
jgi:RNA polymerase sigma factor (sigma-70 family)